MDLTGKKALAFKLAYMMPFNMEAIRSRLPAFSAWHSAHGAGLQSGREGDNEQDDRQPFATHQPGLPSCTMHSRLRPT
jgi:hypothetical protein